MSIGLSDTSKLDATVGFVGGKRHFLRWETLTHIWKDSFWQMQFWLCQHSWFMLFTDPCVNSVPQNPNSQRSVAPGQQRVIYLMVNESLILCKRQVHVARAPADREIFAAWVFSQKVWAVPQAGDKVKEIMFDLLWHSYNYLDPGEGPFLWLGYCHLIFHLKDVKAISLLVVEVRCWKWLNHPVNVFPIHCNFINYY